MAITSANQLELLQTAEAVAREKMIDPALVIEAMEESLARAAKSRYGAEMDIRVSIDRKTGRATFTRVRTVVEEAELENYQAEFTVEQAKQYMENPEVGQQLIEEVPPVEMGRIAAQSAKQVILQKVREAERDRQYEEFKDRAGTIINALVKREEYGNVIVDVGSGEAVLRRNEKIGRESYRPNDRIVATSRTFVANSVARRFSLAVLRPSSWQSCSKWKFLKSMMASLRSRQLPVIPVRAPRLQ
jgi:N utilization substance protein A